MLLVLRSTAFYLGYAAATILWGALSVLTAWVLPYRLRFQFIIGCWTRFSLWWLRVTCGISHVVDGLENLPDEACVVLVRHESTWETLFLQTLLAPQATLIKRELLWLPFFGWAFRLLKPIAIDRRTPRGALKRLISEGRSRLADDIWVVLFPEGTRMPPGVIGKFQVGGAALANAADSPIIVIAHNSGSCWPAHRFVKLPGVIQVTISPPLLPAQSNSKTLALQANDTLREMMAVLPNAGNQTSRFTTDNAFASMNSRRGST